MSNQSALCEQRSAGVLLHISSLPGPMSSGRLGADAMHFMRWLAQAGVSVWQILPIGPTDAIGSPYSLLSAFAGNPLFLNHEGPWQPHEDIALLGQACPSVEALVAGMLGQLEAGEHREWRNAYVDFAAHNAYWLDDYALYDVIRRETGQPWYQWPDNLKHRDAKTMQSYARAKRKEIEESKLLQFLFHVQWGCLRSYASSLNLRIYGDIPIFCAYDSADVWSHPEYFMLDAHGQMLELSGVPPDLFSDTGQLWGSPQYNWERLERDDFIWWVKRIEAAFGYYDLLRIDHFRGLESSWVVPAGSKNAVNGYWKKGPGTKLFEAIEHTLGPVPFVAEDLGDITPEVERLRKQLGIPGMRVLQFDFDGNPDNPHAPHNHTRDSVVYTGTHDNDTLIGWWSGLSETQKAQVVQHVPHPELGIPWSVIDCALLSVGFLAIVPMQDLLGLGSEARMNTPGEAYGNWRWRFQWSDVPGDLCEKTKTFIRRAQR